MFDDKSRYKNQGQYAVKDGRGRLVKVVGVPDALVQNTLGYHLLKQGERVDHLAAKYINNPAGFWRIGQLNDAMLPEAMTEQKEVAIPVK
jgi:hypothetical protein